MGRLPSGLLLSFRPFRPFRPFSEALRAFPIVLRRICRYMMRIPDRFRLFLSIFLVFRRFFLGGDSRPIRMDFGTGRFLYFSHRMPMRFRTGRFAGCMAGRNCRNGSGRARRYWGIPAVSVPGAVHIAACGESALRRSGAGAPSLMCPEKPLAVETNSAASLS